MRYTIFIILFSWNSVADCQSHKNIFKEVLKVVTSNNRIKTKIFIKPLENEVLKAFIFNNETFLENDNEAYYSLSHFNGGPYFYLDDLEVILFKDWTANLSKIPLFIIIDKFRLKHGKARIRFHTNSIVYSSAFYDNYISVSCSLKEVSGVWQINSISVKRIECCDKM